MCGCEGVRVGVVGCEGECGYEGKCGCGGWLPLYLRRQNFSLSAEIERIIGKFHISFKLTTTCCSTEYITI